MHQYKRNRTIWDFVIAFGLVLLLLGLIFLLREGQQPAVVGKGSRLLEDTASWAAAVDQARARDLALADEGVESILSGKAPNTRG